MVYENNPTNPMPLRAVNTCPLDENVVLLQCCQVKNLLWEVVMEFVMQVYYVFFSAFLKLVKPLVKYLAWLQLGAQHYVVGDKL